jgi:hypothetical protein
VLWALVPWLNAGANLLLDEETSAVWEQRRALVIANYAALSLGVAITLWGAARIARRLEVLRETMSRLFDSPPAREPFRELNSVLGPLLLATVGAIVFGVSAYVREGWAAGLLRGSTWFVIGIPFWTFLWAYASLQLGLDRLGRQRLRPDSAGGDPGLGLRPLGDAAFMGLWMLLVWLVPVVVTGLPDVAGFAIGVCLLVMGLAAFFLSLYRLHRQMVEVKAAELAFARHLYGLAYQPVRQAGTLDALEDQRGLLGAADALEKRADAIHEWPVDERTWAWVIGIATSVVAITVARLILNPLGL